MNDSKFLLVLKTAQHLSRAQIESLTELITPTAEALGAEPMVLGSGFDVELKMGSEALLLRVCEALEKIAAQGEAPDVIVADTARQGLNARPSSLNSRPIGTHHGCELPTIPKDGTFPLDPHERVYDGRNGDGYQPKASACSYPLRVPMPPKER